MWTYLIWGGILVASWLINKYGRSAPLPPDSNIANIQAQDSPQCTPGTPIPLVFGRCRVTAPLLVWYSQVQSQLDNDPIPHWRYGMDMLFVVGIPMELPAPFGAFYDLEPKFHQIFIGDANGIPLDNLALTHTQGAVVLLSEGGPGQGGQHCGILNWYNGRTDQLISNNSYTEAPDITAIGTSMTYFNATVLGGVGGVAPDAGAGAIQFATSLIPGFRGQMLVSLTGAPAYGGMFVAQTQADLDDGIPAGVHEIPESGTLGSYSFEVSTYGPLTFSQHGFDGFGDDANPVEVLYDILTSDWGKAAYNSALVDLPSWQACSDVLSTEGHGYSNVLYTTQDAKQAVANICAQINAVLFEDPATGKLVLKLIRADYVVSALPLFTENGGGVMLYEDYDIGNWRETYNVVNLDFTNRAAGYLKDTVVAQNLANAAGQSNRKRPTTISYPGINTAALAAVVASRELGVVSQPLAKARITLDRRAYQLRIGDPFRATLSAYSITDGLVWRAVDIDYGQTTDNKIVVDVIQDAFSSNLAPPIQVPWQVAFLACDPCSERVLMESPRLLSYRAWVNGYINDPDVGRIFALAKADMEDTWPVTLIGEITQLQPSLVVPGSLPNANPFAPDVLARIPPVIASVAVAYPKTLIPFDDITGLVINGVIGSLPPALQNPAQGIGQYGRNLLLIGSEILAFQNVIDHGDGSYTLQGVWRELCDTVAADHAVGARVWFLQGNTGIRGWEIGNVLFGQAQPKGMLLGSGGDPNDQITIAGRAYLPLRVQGFYAWQQGADPIMAGAPLLHGTATQFADLSLLDGGLNLGGWKRERTSTVFTRGITPDEALLSEAQFFIHAQNESAGSIKRSIAMMDNSDTIVNLAQALSIGKAGHGVIDVSIQTSHTLQPTDYEFPYVKGSAIYSFGEPSIRVTAHRWRNLLANARFDYPALEAGRGLGYGWQIMGGTCQVDSASRNIRNSAGLGFYFHGTAGPLPSIRQIVDLTDYLPPNLSARVIWYAKNDNSDTNDTVSVTLDPIVSGAVTNAVVGTVGYYQRRQFSIATLPAACTSVGVTLALNEVAGGGGTGDPDSLVTEVELIVGQHLYDQLTNGSFDADLTGWTVSGSAAGGSSTNRAPSSGYARLSASASLTQVWTLSSGYTYGSVVARYWRMDDTLGAAASITFDCKDGGGTVLLSTTSGVTAMAALNTWYPQLLHFDVPEGTVTILVTITANSTAGACFDDLVASLHKHLAPVARTEALFSTPTAQPVPTTWQAAHLAWPTLPRFRVLEGVIPSAIDADIGWSDGATTYNPVAMFGQWGGFTSSVNGYPFTRQSGSTALRLVAKGSSVTAFCNYGRALGTTRGFTVVVFFRVDEVGLSVPCGLTGRQDASHGWGLSIDGSGQVVATLRGDGGTKSVTRAGSVVADGAVHMAAITWDPALDQLRVSDERGTTTISTATGLGEFAVLTNNVPFELGRDGSGSTHDTLPGAIARCYVCVEPMSAAQVASLWSYAKDPSGMISTYAGQNGWVAQAQGQLVCLASDQVALGYGGFSYNDGNDGQGYGLALVSSANSLNVIPSFTLGDSNWITEAGATRTIGVVDNTGYPLGATLSVTSTAGLRVENCVLGAGAIVTLSFWAYALSGTPTIEIELQNSAGVVKDTLACVLSGGSAWTRYTVSTPLWDASTATGKLRWRATSGTVGFLLGHVLFASQGAVDVPAIWPRLPATALGANVVATLAPTLQPQLNDEGEIVAEGISLVTAPPTSAIAAVHNGSNNKNRRELVAASAAPSHVHYDGAPTATVMTGSAIDWTQKWALRGRWRQGAGLLDTSTYPTRGLAVTVASTPQVVYPSNTAYAVDRTPSTVIDLGAAASAAHPHNCYLRRVRVLTVEEAIPR